MKQTKIFVLVAMAVTALTAVFGVSAASATETALCKETVLFCPGGQTYPAGTKVHAELEAGAKFSVENPIGKVECAKSTIELTTEQTTAKPLGAQVNAFTFGECKVGPIEVEITTLNKGTADIELIDIPNFTHHGTLELTGTEIKVHYKGLGIECRYIPGHSGILTGGAMATIDFAGNWLFVGGSAFCGAGAAPAKGNYTVTAPEPLWVAI